MYATLREKIAAEKGERIEKYARYREIIDAAHAAAHAAALEHRPIPMTVVGSGFVDVVPDGACGFAWITIRPGTASFARWATKNAGFRKAYYGGLELWVSGYNQSIERKERYAVVFSEYLNRHAEELGVTAQAGSRLD